MRGAAGQQDTGFARAGEDRDQHRGAPEPLLRTGAHVGNQIMIPARIRADRVVGGYQRQHGRGTRFQGFGRERMG